MDDNLSTKSSESSITTSGEYEIVTDSNVTSPLEQPSLDIANNRNISDIQNAMTDALKELELDKSVEGGSSGTAAAAAISAKQKSLTLPLTGTTSPALMVPQQLDKSQDNATMKTKALVNHLSGGGVGGNNATSSSTPTPKSEDSTSDLNRVGQSVFYDCTDALGERVKGDGADLDEKQDIMKPEKNDTDDDISEIDQGCTIFSGVTYLGAANINAPKSETDVYRIMSELNSGTSTDGLKISISIPNCSDGLVVLHDAETNSIIQTYEVQSIILYFRGPIETVEHGCFAFTWLHGESLFQCHVFRCHIPEAVNQVSACFQKAFQTYPPSMTCSLISATENNMMNSITSDISGNPLNTAGYEFHVSLEIREKVAKNSYAPVPRDRGTFKLRANTDKEVYITVKQTPSTVLQPLFIDRCFGVLLSPGKLVRQADMRLIDMISMGYVQQQPASSNNSSGGGAGDAPPPITPLCLNPYHIQAEWKASEKAFDQLNVETSKTFLTVAVDIVMRGIQEPVRFVIETPVQIQSAGELRIMDHFISKRPMTLRFYLHLKRTTDEFSWKVSSIDPAEEIVEQPQQSSSSSSYLLKIGMNNLSRIVRSSSIASIEDDCPTDSEDMSDGDEPLLSGTGEVPRDCPQDTLDEWDPVLREWDGEKRPKNLPPLVRLGIPEAMREMIWKKLAGIESKTEMLDMYKILITKETKCETVILRDIHRTFPAHKCFRETGGSGQDALFKVSKAYAVYDSEVGYCQGLSFIAASLLLHMPEEDAFCVLVTLMYDYGLRDLYKQGFEALYLRHYQLERLIKDQLPKLHEHFVNCGIETHMYASQWFLTLFTARFPLCFVFHVLDVFLLDGINVLFQVALTLLSICENDLRQLDFEGILKYFRVTLPKKCRSPSQARRIMKIACERKIKKLKIYEDEFKLQKQDKERLEKESQLYENRFGAERRKLQSEINELQQKLAEANERAIEREKKHTNIIQDYKQIIQRLEQDMTTMNETLGNLMSTVAKCENCSKHIEKDIHANNAINPTMSSSTSNDNRSPTTNMNTNANEATLGPLDPLNAALQHIRELELELAQAKLAQVEAECKNQDLNHQLSTTITEMQSNRNSWQPWFSKTLNTLQEKVTPRNNREQQASFQSYMSSATGSETNSPSGHQEFKAFSVSNSPKLPSKFQAARLRNSIDSLRNIMVVPLENTGKHLLNETLKQQQPQAQTQQLQ
ncbi:rab GTPase-activating protein 1-like [Musca vetustissima]|uniref:rab GTPase-activating protein 1-like n=1 Tax=Musca vetustissima TaxID=27455 RepID=UPI002AB75E6C|nr:rab GTPase-activating protein 1-like [Musca vetustissima]